MARDYFREGLEIGDAIGRAQVRHGPRIYSDGHAVEPLTRHEAGQELDAKARRLMAGTALSYVEAFERVREDPDNAEIVKTYACGPSR